MEDAAVDIQRACDELKISKEIYLRIALKAVEQTAEELDDLRQAHLSSDIEKLKAMAHRFKGDYANLRIGVLSESAVKLEESVRNNDDWENSSALIEQFITIFQRVKEFLEAQN